MFMHITVIIFRLLAYGTGNITGYTKSDWHDIEIKLIDSKKRATEV